LNSRLLAVSALLCILTLAFVGFSQAQQVTSGVRPGMSFFYDVSSNWSSSDAYASIPPDLILVNQTSCIEIRIGEVNSPYVSISSMGYYKDGTTDFERGNVNLNTGEGYGFVGIIGANLQVGDKIHPDGEDTLTVLDTSTRIYENNARVTSHIRIVDDNYEEGYIATRDLYFDQETGILVEQKDKTETTISPIVVSCLTWKIVHVIGVDDWSISGFSMPTVPPVSNTKLESNIKWYLLLVVAVLLSITIAVLIYKKKLVKRKFS
jgi:hypothetical protein